VDKIVLLTILRKLIYFLFFIVIFLFFVYFYFPIYTLRSYFSESLEFSLKKQGYDISKVFIKNISLWKITGISFNNITVTLNKGKLLNKIIIRKVFLTINFWDFFWGDYKFLFEIHLHSGKMGGNIVIDKCYKIRNFNVNVKTLTIEEENIGKIPLLGVLKLDGYLFFENKFSSGIKSSINVKMEDCSITLSQISTFFNFTNNFFDIKIYLGNITAKISIINGKFLVNKILIRGKNVVCKMKGHVYFLNKLIDNDFIFSGWLILRGKFLERDNLNDKIIKLIPEECRRDIDSSDFYSFVIKGAFDNPIFHLLE